jgi:tetratricopeptide (TPR) repeat protein
VIPTQTLMTRSRYLRERFDMSQEQVEQALLRSQAAIPPPRATAPPNISRPSTREERLRAWVELLSSNTSAAGAAEDSALRSVRAEQMSRTREFVKQRSRTLQVTQSMLSAAEQCQERGVRHFQAGELPKALAAFELAMTKNPKATQLLSYTATIRVKLGEQQQAIQDANECIRLHPTFAGGYKAKATALDSGGDAEAALRTLDAGLASVTGNEKKKAPLAKLRQQIAARRQGSPSNSS